MKFHIVLRKEPEWGYTVLVPSLPGCITYWETIEEAHVMAREAIEGYLLTQQDLQESVVDDTESVFDTIFISPSKNLLANKEMYESSLS